jgi:hypothetical protein
MPLYEFTFIDTSTIQVLAPSAADAKAHVDHLVAESKFVDNGYRGKALASPDAREVDKFAQREAENAALRAGS